MAKSNWFYETNGQQTGPVSVKQLRQLATNGLLQPTDRVRKEGMDRWVRARAVRGLFADSDANAESIPEQIEGDTVFDFFGNPPAPDAIDEARAAELRSEFDFFSGAPSTPAGPRKPSQQRKSKPELPPTMAPAQKRSPNADDAPIPMSASMAEVSPDVPMAEVVEENVPLTLAEEMPMAAPVSPEFGTQPDLVGLEIVLKSDGAAEPSGAALALSLHNGWLTAKATMPDGAVQESYLKVDCIDVIEYRARPDAGEPNSKLKVLSFHAGRQCVALMCQDGDSAVRAFVQLVMAGV